MANSRNSGDGANVSPTAFLAPEAPLEDVVVVLAVPLPLPDPLVLIAWFVDQVDE